MLTSLLYANCSMWSITHVLTPGMEISRRFPLSHLPLKSDLNTQSSKINVTLLIISFNSIIVKHYSVCFSKVNQILLEVWTTCTKNDSMRRKRLSICWLQNNIKKKSFGSHIIERLPSFVCWLPDVSGISSVRIVLFRI